MTRGQTESERVEASRALRDRVDESSVLAFHVLKRSSFGTELCVCGAQLLVDDFGVCGPCGREQGTR